MSDADEVALARVRSFFMVIVCIRVSWFMKDLQINCVGRRRAEADY